MVELKTENPAAPSAQCCCKEHLLTVMRKLNSLQLLPANNNSYRKLGEYAECPQHGRCDYAVSRNWIENTGGGYVTTFRIDGETANHFLQ